MFPSILQTATAFLSLTSLVLASPQQVSSIPSATQAPSSASTQACNNSPLLCNRNYNDITHMGGHNAAFVRDRTTSFSTSGNQYYNATVALSAGLRLLSAQVHRENNTVRLCHSSCTLLDAGLLQTWLGEIKSWMDTNPREVVTLILVNSDDLSAAQFGSIFRASGISTYGYTPSSTPQATWPTLQTMITANTRLVTFIASIAYDATFPYLLPEFDFVFETAFGVTSQDGFNCTLDRPSSQGTATAAIGIGYMGMVNHFLDDAQSFFQAPNTALLDVTNAATLNTRGTLGTQAQQCQQEWGVRPTFILVNFFNVGPAMATADQLNGIQATGRTALSTQQLTQTSGGMATAGSGRSAILIAGCLIAIVALGNFVWL